MGRLAQKTLLSLLCLSATVCQAEDICPVVRVVGLNSTKKLTILQGCPGIPGKIGPKGDQGITGITGQWGFAGTPGKAGKTGLKGETGGVGPSGLKGDKGDPGDPGPSGVPGEEVLEDIQCKKGARSCKELLAKGNLMSDWYTIYPHDCNALTVLCDMHTDGGGWIVIQRRVDGSVDFLRDWDTYKRGFGSRLSEFWLGNDNIHMLTSLGPNELRVDLRDFDNHHEFAIFSSFKIAGEDENYKLNIGDYVNGTAGDSLTEHNNMMFTTQDRDNDLSIINCAVAFKGAWWYKNCHMSNLNGLYLTGVHDIYGAGVNWSSGKGRQYSYWLSEMKIRPV